MTDENDNSLKHQFALFWQKLTESNDRLLNLKERVSVRLLGAHDDIAKRQKSFRIIRYIFSIFAVLVIAASFFAGNTPTEQAEKFEIPTNTTNPEKRIILPDGRDMSAKDAIAQIDKRQTVADSKKKQITTYLGPQVILRNLAGQIPEGIEVHARLLSGASNGRIKAILTENISVRGDVLMESGTVLIGDGSSTEDRLNIQFRKAVFRDGSTASIEAQAIELSDSIVGLKGSKLSSKAGQFAASVGLNFIGGMSIGLTANDFQNGQMPTSDRIKNSILTGASTAAIEEGRNLMNERKSKAPIIEVPKDTEFLVLFTGN